MYKYILPFITVFLFIMSCEKDVELNMVEKLTQHTWVQTKQLIDPPITLTDTINDATYPDITDVYPFFYYDCEKDNIYNYSSNGTFTIEDGALSCYTGLPNTLATGTWTFNSKETELIVTSGIYQNIYKVTKLDAGYMELSYSVLYDTVSNVIYTLTDVFEHSN